MIKRITATLIILILTITTIYSQNFEPFELAQKIFGKDSLFQIDNYKTGEYEGRPNGQDLQKGTTTKFLLLGQTDKKAVVAMTILDSLGKGVDTYLHFEKDSVWKMNAFRGFAMTGIIELVINDLEKMTPEQVDEVIIKSKKNKKNDYSMFTSREDYDFQLGNAKLTIESDDNIFKHFISNQSEFERLKNIALTQIKKNKDENRSINLIENLKADYQKLFISSVSTGGYELGNCINFLIGGMVDNTVGYIYVKDKNDIPEMNPDRIIMIREIGNGWYIYKTT